MVAGDQVGVLIVQALKAAEMPAGTADQVHPGFVVADPGLVGMVHQPVAEALGEGEWQHLEERDAEQKRAQQQGVQRQ
ncbi:hypothetical protein D3C80_1881950 [compost metagenome]